MTLILTRLGPYGIVQASDSNVTAGSSIAEGKKVFEVPHLHAALGVAGAYSVGSRRMDDWMPEHIATEAQQTGQDLRSFADRLAMRLDTEMTADEKGASSIVHLAGYAADASGHHPEFYHVRNIPGLRNDGSYLPPVGRFSVSEDFWTRDRHQDGVDITTSDSWGWLYLNGYPPGRIAYLELLNELRSFLERVWGRYGGAWRFRRPRTLEETAELVRVHLQLVGGLFRVSDYQLPYVGGEVQMILVPPPS